MQTTRVTLFFVTDMVYNSSMYIKVRVIADSKKEKVIKESDDHFTISIKEKAERNLANSKILEIISNIYNTKKVKIISGHHSPSKLLSVGD